MKKILFYLLIFYCFRSSLLAAQNLVVGNFTIITSNPSGTSAGQTGQIVLKELAGNGTNTVAVSAADSIPNNSVIVLPSNNAPAPGYPLPASSVAAGVIGLDYNTITTSATTEGANLYFTNPHARTAISAGAGISYDSSSGVISAGSVSSVGLSMPPNFTVTGSPITANGTLAVTETTFIDPSTIKIIDDFVSNSQSTSPNVNRAGKYWVVQANSGTVGGSTLASIANHPGLLRLISANTLNSADEIALTDLSGTHGAIMPLYNISGWDSTFIFNIQSVNGNAELIAGFRVPGTVGGDPQGIYIETTKNNSGNTPFTFVCKDGSGTTSTTSIARDGNYHKFRIRSTTPGTISFSVDGGVESTINQNIPTTELIPTFMSVSTVSGNSSAMGIDYFSFYASGLSR